MTRHILIALALTAMASPALAADASFTLVNRGSNAVKELFVTPAGDANWGQNRLAGRSITPGGNFLVKRRADGNCILDIKAVFADGKTEERKALNTCNIDAVAVGLAVGATAVPGPRKESGDPSVRLVNRGTQAITEFFVAAPGHTDWGANRLSAGPLPAATEKLVHVDGNGACLFDLRVVFADRTAKEKHGTDLCKITDLPVP
jgi:hypothetical protein